MKKILKIKEPDISLIERKEVNNCLKKTEISTYGSLVENIGKNLSSYNGAKYNLPLNSGTAALLLGFKSMGIHEDDLVITQSFTFGATTNSIINANAKPWLFDIDELNLSIDLSKLENILKQKTFSKNGHTFLKKNKKRVFAICPVTSFGIIPNLSKLKKISKKYNLKIIIDAACAFGNKYNSKQIIEYADVVAYSFNGNKNITSGGGGLLSTNNQSVFKKAKILAENGKTKGNYVYSMFGHNYKMTNLHAAILKGQLSRYADIKNKLLKIHEKYNTKINNDDFRFFSRDSKNNNVFWLNFVLCKNQIISKKLINYLNTKNIYSNYFWTPMHLQSLNKKFIVEDMNFTEKFYKRIVLIPSSSFLKGKEINYIINTLNNFKA